MKTTLTNQEREIIECMASEWDRADSLLYGGISYKMVYDLLKKLKVEIPQNLDWIVKCEDDKLNTIKYAKLTKKEKETTGKRWKTIQDDINKESEILRKEGFFNRD